MSHPPGALVFAKIKGFSHWPARINPLPSEVHVPRGKLPVFFYGTHQVSFVSLKNIVPFEKFKHKLGKPKSNAQFTAAMEEIDSRPKVLMLGEDPEAELFLSRFYKFTMQSEDINAAANTREAILPSDSFGDEDDTALSHRYPSMKASSSSHLQGHLHSVENSSLRRRKLLDEARQKAISDLVSETSSEMSSSISKPGSAEGLDDDELRYEEEGNNQNDMLNDTYHSFSVNTNPSNDNAEERRRHRREERKRQKKALKKAAKREAKRFMKAKQREERRRLREQKRAWKQKCQEQSTQYMSMESTDVLHAEIDSLMDGLAGYDDSHHSYNDGAELEILLDKNNISQEDNSHPSLPSFYREQQDDNKPSVASFDADQQQHDDDDELPDTDNDDIPTSPCTLHVPEASSPSDQSGGTINLLSTNQNDVVRSRKRSITCLTMKESQDAYPNSQSPCTLPIASAEPGPQKRHRSSAVVCHVSNIDLNEVAENELGDFHSPLPNLDDTGVLPFSEHLSSNSPQEQQMVRSTLTSSKKKSSRRRRLMNITDEEEERPNIASGFHHHAVDPRCAQVDSITRAELQSSVDTNQTLSHSPEAGNCTKYGGVGHRQSRPDHMRLKHSTTGTTAANDPSDTASPSNDSPPSAAATSSPTDPVVVVNLNRLCRELKSSLIRGQEDFNAAVRVLHEFTHMQGLRIRHLVQARSLVDCIRKVCRYTVSAEVREAGQQALEHCHSIQKTLTPEEAKLLIAERRKKTESSKSHKPLPSSLDVHSIPTAIDLTESASRASDQVSTTVVTSDLDAKVDNVLSQLRATDERLIASTPQNRSDTVASNRSSLSGVAASHTIRASAVAAATAHIRDEEDEESVMSRVEEAASKLHSDYGQSTISSVVATNNDQSSTSPRPPSSQQTPFLHEQNSVDLDSRIERLMTANPIRAKKRHRRESESSRNNSSNDLRNRQSTNSVSTLESGLSEHGPELDSSTSSLGQQHPGSISIGGTSSQGPLLVVSNRNAHSSSSHQQSKLTSETDSKHKLDDEIYDLLGV